MKEKLMDEHVENISGGIPGQLITHTVSTVVNTLLSSENSGNASNGSTQKSSKEADPLKAAKFGSKLFKF